MHEYSLLVLTYSSIEFQSPAQSLGIFQLFQHKVNTEKIKTHVLQRQILRFFFPIFKDAKKHPKKTINVVVSSALTATLKIL